ncbi:MAG: TlpA family protein disulfide reductase [Acidobacteria bacterium]|nr:MAG: TlpA family protein disulfide reductase [Acidobacteriota bacterium]
MSTKRGKCVLISIFTLIVFSGQSLAQVAQVEPERPKWGDTLTVTYNPKAEGAKLFAADEIYVSAVLYFPGHMEHLTEKMHKMGDVFKYELTIEPHLSYVQLYFITLDDWDMKARVETMVYRPDGVPAKGAYQQKMTPRKYKEFFNKEIALYPDNYAAYRNKWWLASSVKRENVVSVIKKDIETLTRQVKGEPVDFLYALSYGYLLLGREKKSREILKKMVVQYPTSPFTWAALDDYSYQAFAQQFKGEGPEDIKKLKWKLIEQYPNTEFARQQVAFTDVTRDEDFPLRTVETICQQWIEDEPENPAPRFYLALSYHTHQQKIERAASLIEHALDLFLQGKLRLYGDISGQQTELLMPSAYALSAEMSMQQNNYAKALAAIKAAQALEKGTNPRTYILEGRIWQQLSQPSRAESAYLKAWHQGSREAEDLLKALYKKMHGSLAGFEEHLAKKMESSTTSTASERSAPAFRVTTLDGEEFDLAALHGKIAVLNFWFIGCAPCRVEIPGLNKLVDEFKGKDVAFIAFALDDEEALRKFLKETTFKYHIVPRAGEIAKQFGVSVFPTHIIIDKRGRIYSFLTGGSVNRHEDLRVLIERLLKQR